MCVKNLLILIVMIELGKSANKVGQRCVDEKTNKEGACKLPDGCPGQLNTVPTLCGFENFVQPIICCVSAKPQQQTIVKTKKHKERKSYEMCQKYTQTDCKFDRSPLIVGGEETKEGEFPFMASLRDDAGYFCGGSIISDKYIMTAGHCTSRTRVPTKIKMGHHKTDIAQPNSIVRNVKNIIPHPKYKPTFKYYDISLIEVDSLIVFSDFIRPVCLWANSKLTFDKTVATGWGIGDDGTAHTTMHKVELNIFSNSVCNGIFSGDEIPNGIVDGQLCVGDPEQKRDTCKGDSGGPIFYFNGTNNCQHYVIGITSFGTVCGKYQAVYTNVYSYLEWIESVVWP